MTKNKNIKVSRLEWLSMHHIPKKMKCDSDTAKQLIKVFGNNIINDIEINKKEVKEKDGRQNEQ